MSIVVLHNMHDHQQNVWVARDRWKYWIKLTSYTEGTCCVFRDALG